MSIVTIIGNRVQQATVVCSAFLALILLGSTFQACAKKPAVSDAIPQVAVEKKTIEADHLIHPLATSYAAPELEGILQWVNTKPLKLAELRGKVVLVDFWTYSCINCIRTLPYLTDWYDKYEKDGFVIVGVHAPEFEFERNLMNVQKAVKKYAIRYPVALDSDYGTWTKFKNTSWPSHYLIDKSGKVVYHHSGEGSYDVTENNIRHLLGLKAPAKVKAFKPEYSAWQTHETYLNQRGLPTLKQAEMVPVKLGEQRQFVFPNYLSVHRWALNGAWAVEKERTVSAKSGASLRLNFFAKKVYLVIGSSQKNARLTVMLDGKPVAAKLSGRDVKNAHVAIDGHRLYELINLPKAVNATLELQADMPGVELYAFTFGS